MKSYKLNELIMHHASAIFNILTYQYAYMQIYIDTNPNMHTTREVTI